MTLVTFTDPGAFTNGVSPLSAAVMNDFRNFCVASGAMWDSNASWDGNGILTFIGAKINPVGVVLAGTIGTATAYQVLRGTYKIVVIYTNNFQNTSGVTTAITLPTAFTSWVYVRTGTIFQCELRIGATPQNINVLTTIGASGGTVTSQSFISSHSFGHCAAAIDTFSFRTGGSSGQTSGIILEGV